LSSASPASVLGHMALYAPVGDRQLEKFRLPLALPFERNGRGNPQRLLPHRGQVPRRAPHGPPLRAVATWKPSSECPILVSPIWRPIVNSWALSSVLHLCVGSRSRALHPLR